MSDDSRRERFALKVEQQVFTRELTRLGDECDTLRAQLAAATAKIIELERKIQGEDLHADDGS